MSEQTIQNKTEFNIKLDHQTLKQVIEGIGSLSEECTLTIDNEGITSKCLDPSHVAMINVSLPNSMFEKYEVTKQGNISFHIADMLKILNDIPKESSVKILNDADDLILMANNTTYYLKLSEASTNDQPMPKIPYDSKFQVYELTKYMTRLIKFSPYVLIECTNQTLKLSAKDDTIKLVSIKLEKGMDELITLECKNGNSECPYSIEYMLPFLKTVPKGTLQTVQFSNQKPLRISIGLSNTNGFIDLYVAPRIES